jgi:hypothetical protein
LSSASHDLFEGTLIVHPPADLSFAPRKVGDFVVAPRNRTSLTATSTIVDAANVFQQGIQNELKELSIDLIWECCVAVEFEPAGGRRARLAEDGTQLIEMFLHETIDASGGNPKYGIPSGLNLNLLPDIRDRIITKHLALDQPQCVAKLMSDAALLIAVEHFAKGVVNKLYALPEFYLVLETIENSMGDRRKLIKDLGFSKAEIDTIAYTANEGQRNHRHAPIDATNIKATSDAEINSAAHSAREIIKRYAALQQK